MGQRQILGRRRGLHVVLCAAATAAIAPPHAGGSTFEWTNPVAGAYSDAGNWTLTSGATAAPPVVGDTAVFNESASPYTVTFVAHAASNQLNVTAGTVTFASSGGAKTYALTTGAADASISGATLTLGQAGAPITLAVGDELVVDGGATLNVYHGSDVTTSDLFVADTGSGESGTIVVDGTGSTFSVTGATAINLGLNGNTAGITYRNAASGNLTGGALNIGLSFLAASNGVLNVQSNADVDTGTIDIGGSTGTGALTVTGAGSTVEQTVAASNLTVGDHGTLTAASGGSFSTNTGLTKVDVGGLVNINGGTFNANGDVLVNNGTLSRSSSGVFNLAAGRNLTAQNGGQVNFTGAYAIGNGTTFIIQGGADFTTTGFLHVGNPSTGTLVVDGAGSSLTIAGEPVWGGGAGGNASVTLRNNAVATVNSALGVAIGGSTATVDVESGADMTVSGTLFVGFQTGSTGTANLDGAGSTVTAMGGIALGTFGGVGTVNVTNNAILDATLGTSELGSGGTLNITSSVVTLGTLVHSGGTINFNSGSLSYAGNLTVGAGGLFGGGSVTIGSEKSLSLTGTTTIDPLRVLTLSGGTLNTGSLVNNGTFNFTGGTLGITGASGLTIGGGGALGSSFALGTGSNVIVTNAATVNAGASLAVNGGSFSAPSLTNAGTVIANGGALAITGTIDNQAGGLLAVAPNQLLDTSAAITNAGEIQLQGLAARITGAGAITNTGLIRGDGRISKPLTNDAGGEIRIESGGRIAFQSAFAGNAGRITLLGGTAEFTGGGLTNGATGLISGRGTLVAPSVTNNGQVTFSAGLTDVFATLTNNAGGKVFVTGGGTSTFYAPVTLNSGSEFRVSTGSTAVFLGDVTGFGAGSFTGSGTKIFEAGATSVSSIATSTGATVVEASARVTTGHVREASLTVNGVVTITPDGTNAGTSRVNALAIGNGGARLELNDNDIIVDYAGPSPEDEIRNWVIRGRSSGTGISTRDTVDDDTVLAVANNVDWGKSAFDGQPIDTSTIVGKYTFFGDANLDGKVTGDDYLNVDANLGTGDSWLEGDFNMSGVTTGDDYLAVDANLGKGTSNPLPYAELKAEMVQLHRAMFGEEYLVKLALAESEGFGATVVPEPVSAGLLATACGCVVLGKRRRQARS